MLAELQVRGRWVDDGTSGGRRDFFSVEATVEDRLGPVQHAVVPLHHLVVYAECLAS